MHYNRGKRTIISQREQVTNTQNSIESFSEELNNKKKKHEIQIQTTSNLIRVQINLF